MDYISSFRSFIRMRWLAVTLIGAMLSWALGIPFLFHTASASQLSLISATASSSAPSVLTNYMVRFTTINSWGYAASASTTRITFDPVGNSFDLSSLVVTDVFVSRAGGGLTQVANVGACGAGTDEVYVASVSAAGPDYVELSTCTGDTVAAGAITVNIANSHVGNPATYGSRVVRIGGGAAPMVDSGDTRVAIISSVTVTAIVDTNLTFTIAGVASSSLVNGDTTSTSTSATAIGFGVLSVGTSSIAAQDLTVQTNALNGFSVTVTENQDLKSNNGADINAFDNGNPVTGAPVAWANPAGTLSDNRTYGHMGITSDDSTLPADDFGVQLYAGLTSTSTRTVMYHTGVADGTTQDIGKARVGYRVMITALQEAAVDYNNVLTYVATPIF